MSDDKTHQPPAAVLAGEASEEKRRAARRRFLMRGAASSGVVIVTLYHQRGALAGAKKAPTIFTSSVEFCLSLKGQPAGKKDPTGPTPSAIPNPNDPSQKIPAFECTGVPDYKVPWNTGMKK